MIALSNRWLVISAIGQGVIFSLALTGLVRMVYWLSGSELSQQAAGNLFMLSSLIAGSISGFLCVRHLRIKDGGATAISHEERT